MNWLKTYATFWWLVAKELWKRRAEVWRNLRGGK